MRYEATVKPLLIALSFTFYTFTTATICQPGEVGLGYVASCFSPKNVQSCDSYHNPWNGAILSNNCDIVGISSHESFCQGAWLLKFGDWLPNLSGTASCDATDVPNRVDTTDKNFNNCYQVNQDTGINYQCPRPDLRHPYTVELAYCCPPVNTEAPQF